MDDHSEPRGTGEIPTKPAGYDLQEVTEDDLSDFTPELRQAALAILGSLAALALPAHE